MQRIKEVIVVEGRYDKNTLSQVVDAVIIETGGFGIFNDREKRALLKRLAETRGLILMTDSDGAGFMIRNHLKGCIDQKLIRTLIFRMFTARSGGKPKAPGRESWAWRGCGRK